MARVRRIRRIGSRLLVLGALWEGAVGPSGAARCSDGE